MTANISAFQVFCEKKEHARVYLVFDGAEYVPLAELKSV